MEGFFMSKKPKNITQPKGGATWHGFVPDTDPRYSSGWNFLAGKDLRPQPSERERVSLANRDQEKPE
jgi:hypothetical protein